MKESEIQKAIIDYMKSRGYFVNRMPLGGVMMNVRGKKFMRANPLKGFPDIFFLLKDRSGRMGVIEVKTPKGRLSADQKEWLTVLEYNGVKCHVGRSIEDVEIFLNRIEKERCNILKPCDD